MSESLTFAGSERSTVNIKRSERDSAQIVVDDAAALWLCKRIKQIDRRHEWKQIQHSRTRDEKLLLILPSKRIASALCLREMRL